MMYSCGERKTNPIYPYTYPYIYKYIYIWYDMWIADRLILPLRVSIINVSRRTKNTTAFGAKPVGRYVVMGNMVRPVRTMPPFLMSRLHRELWMNTPRKPHLVLVRWSSSVKIRNSLNNLPISCCIRRDLQRKFHKSLLISFSVMLLKGTPPSPSTKNLVSRNWSPT